MFEKIEINYVFIEKIHNFYGKTITDYGKGNNILFLKEMSIWRKLRTAYQEDMKVYLDIKLLTLFYVYFD